MKIFNLILTLIFVFFSAQGLGQEKKETRTLKWVLAHEPIELFLPAAQQFSEEVNQKTKGRIKIDVMSFADFTKKHLPNKKVYPKHHVELIRKGNIDIGQTYTTELGRYNHDMFVLDLPFMFKTHEHAAKVLEGSVGENLMASLEKSNIRGLAFTYSGGYRVIPSTKKITKLSDFKGLRVSTSSSPVANETLKALGATPVQIALEDVSNAVKSGKLDASELTYARFYPMKQNQHAKYVTESYHSLFLTAMIINDGVWKSLSAEDKEIFKNAATRAARLERKQSLDQVDSIKQKCENDGITITRLPASEMDQFSKIVQPVYEKFQGTFSPDLVKSIQAQK